MPSPSNPPQGCHFHPRCPHVNPECRQSYPSLTRLTQTHQLRCHLFE
jgi:peptide/nickel transport system ATP-binding protein